LPRFRTQLLIKRHSIDAQLDQLRAQEAGEQRSLDARSSALEAERDSVRASIDDQRRRLAYAEQAAERYREVEARGFLSREQAEARRDAALEQRARLGTLEREGARLDRELADARHAAETLAASYASRLAELARAAATVELELTENEARRRVLVVAPQAGMVAAVTAQIGQAVAAGEALALVVPAGAALQAHLYAPSAAVGFLDPGDQVLLRYDAYAYEKFGHQRGTVASISRSAVPAAGSAPLYRIIVDLERQTVPADGVARTLRAGMAVEADIVQETRRLYEWALEPLLALGDRPH
jgi:membrane fusion protein